MPLDRRDPKSGKPTYTAGAMAVVRDERGRILWIRRRQDDRWELPGGVIEFGETPEAAACREVNEESGFDVDVVRLALINSRHEVGDIVLCFECRLRGGEARTSDESSEVALIDPMTPPDAPARYVEHVRDVIGSPDRLILVSIG
jgi:8-oxo-dGTP pyrophosphatase MutT (NUDIX family)